MDFKREFLRLYAVTDRTWLHGRTLEECVTDALRGGVTMVQLREKNMPFDALVSSAKRIKKICREYGVPLIINDSAMAAAEADADGVHLGQGDMSAIQARRILGADKIIGVTAKTIPQALLAQSDGADYIGSGAVFGSATKTDAVKMELEALREITRACKLPTAAIGGIDRDNILKLCGTGIAGVAVVSGIFAADDICAAARDLYEKAGKAGGYI